jgi:hypothetical protein
MRPRRVKSPGRTTPRETSVTEPSPARLRWGLRVIAVALASGLLLAPRLFLATRAYPRVPVLDSWPSLGAPLDLAVLGALLASLAGVALSSRPRWWAAGATALALIQVADDQSRWQPWFFQYVAMLAAFALARAAAETLAAWRAVLVGLYLWSGIQKLNATFMTNLFPWLVEPVAGLLPAGLQRVLLDGWVVVPLMEIAVAVGLLVPRLRSAAVMGAIATHLVVLGLLGPLARAANAVIWPWNVAMATLAALLFWGDRHAASSILVPRRLGAHPAALAVFLILPALSFSGHWDAYLSGALYSGNVQAAALAVTDGVAARLPEPARRHVARNQMGANVLDVWEWSMGELAVPSYPEDRIFSAVARDVCHLAAHPADVVLVVFGRPGALTGRRAITRRDCAALGGSERGYR